ncbi:MAG: 2-C-methyl-D-erythritol 4-phosphate cytidylyltransferase [Fulvivirga sp.]
MTRNQYAIIVAGGKGTRMNSTVPKQFMELNGLPVLMHTINAFYDYSEKINIILVLPESDIETWQQLCTRHNFTKSLTVTPGGDSRFESVKNGLNKINGTEGLVAIHDGVRPLVTADIIGASFRLASIHQSAIAVVRLKESIRITDQDTTKAVDRSSYRLIQTPQTFALNLIKEAYNIKEAQELTDDASVAEKAGFKISLFEGSYENLKITTPEDLIIAEALLNNRKNRG